MASHDILSTAKPIKLKITKEINGAWTADMQILPDDYIASEGYVDIENEEYIIKSLNKIKSKGLYYYDVSLYHNGIAELSDLTIDRFYQTDSVSDLLTLILSGTPWSAGTCDISENVVLVSDRRISVLEALNLLANNCDGELYFHSKTRVVDLKREIGTDTRLQLRYDKNCTYIGKTEDTKGLVTRIFPYGPDNFTINTTTISDCEDEAVWTPSGAATVAASTVKQNGSQGVEITATALDETFICDLGAGNVVDLSDCETLKFWIYTADDNANGYTFGIGESAYTDNTTVTGALVAGCWKEVPYDISGIAAASKNAIRYIGFKNLTDGAAVAVIDNIRAFSDEIYIDSANKSLYRYNKEYVYNHSAKVEQTQSEVLIYPSDDAFVYRGKATTNYGTASTLKIRDFGSVDYISFIKFALTQIPTGATIVEALLYLYVSATQFSSGGNADIKLPSADWSASTITWNNKPGTAGNVTTLDGNSIGWKEIDLTSTTQDWWSGATANYGLRLELNVPDINKIITIDSDEGEHRPYFKIIYTVPTDPSPIIKAAAQEYLAEHDEPKLLYKIKAVDLSKVMVDTWEDETINLGDTVRIYDYDLGLNINVRVKKITKNLLDPTDIDIELANKAYTIADTQTKIAKQLKYLMPFEDNDRIGYANTIQKGYLGGDVNL